MPSHCPPDANPNLLQPPVNCFWGSLWGPFRSNASLGGRMKGQCRARGRVGGSDLMSQTTPAAPGLCRVGSDRRGVQKRGPPMSVPPPPPPRGGGGQRHPPPHTPSPGPMLDPHVPEV